MTDTPKLGAIRANATDYAGRIVVEQYAYWNSAWAHWAVPTWDERGAPDLCGPFATLAEAEAAVKAELELFA